MVDPLSLYSRFSRGMLLLSAGALTAGISALDWWHPSYISLGFLYVFPIIVAAGVVGPLAIAGSALFCAALQELLGDLPGHEAVVRFVLSSVGFAATGLFVWEAMHSRRAASVHVAELEKQVQLRRDAEQQLRALVDSSPAAILTTDGAGRIVVANAAAQSLLAPGGPDLAGQPIARFVPSLQAVLDAGRVRPFRTSLQARAVRHDGQAFLAAAWFSTYATSQGQRLAAIVVDMSDDLRAREDLSLDHLLRNTRVVMTAVAHEVRNLSSAILVVHHNLSRLPALEGNEDFDALGTLAQSLQRIAEEELRPRPAEREQSLDLLPVLDELRVLTEATLSDQQVECCWSVPSTLPMVQADRNGLMQVFLNLVRNSGRAMREAATRRLSVSVSREGERVVVRFCDTGTGVGHPDELFQPFRRSSGATGMGLYVSRAIMRSYGGDLVHEPTAEGACFGVVLTAPDGADERRDD